MFRLPSHHRQLVRCLLWIAASGLFAASADALCGDGTLDLAEQCDDGNTVSGDCCSALCQFEASGDSCSDGLVCNGNETCDGAGACRAGTPGLGALFRGEIVVADPRTADPLLDPIIVAVDPVSGDQTPLTIGGLLNNPRDVAVETNRCLIVPEDTISAVLRVDPLSYDPQDPGANQTILAQGGNLGSPRGAAIASDGSIFIADFSLQHRIHRIHPVTGAQTIVAQGGYLFRPRHLALDAQGLVYVPVYDGAWKPAIVRINPDTYNPSDAFANQFVVASGGFLNTNDGPWDLGFAPNGDLLVVNAQDWNVIRVDVAAYDPGNPFANQEIVASGFNEIRGIAPKQDGHVIVTQETPAAVFHVDPGAYDPLDPASNRTLIASGLPLTEPRGADVVGIGRCGNGVLETGEQCDDGNEAGGDCCSEICTFEISGASCASDACSVGGTCDGAGACTGTTPVVCDDGQFCNGAESCDPALGCQSGTPPTSDDGIACTVESCDEDSDAIVHTPDDAACSDGAFCNGAEVCSAVSGCGPGTPPAVDDGIACTADSCDEAGDAIVHAPDDAACDDGQFCNGAEICFVATGCGAGEPPSADDGIGCTDAQCDEATDSFSHVPNDANCDDGLVCTGVETCDPDLDCRPGTPQVEGALAWGDIVVADPRESSGLPPFIVAIDPESGDQTPISAGGLLNDPRDVAVEANRCVLVPDWVTQRVIRIDPLAYDPQDPGANQTILSQGGSLGQPRGIAITSGGDVFVADNSATSRIVRIDPLTGAQTVVAQGGHIHRPRNLTADASGHLLIPVGLGASAPSVVQVDPNAFDPSDPLANQQLVASDGFFAATNGPWDVQFDMLGRLFVLNAQLWNLIRVDVSAYDPGDPFANQEIVGDGGSFIMTRGLALGRNGWPIVTNEGGETPILFSVDPDAYEPLDPPSNQVVIASGAPMVLPRGVDVVPLPEPLLPGWGVALLAAAIGWASRRRLATRSEMRSTS